MSETMRSGAGDAARRFLAAGAVLCIGLLSILWPSSAAAQGPASRPATQPAAAPAETYRLYADPVGILLIVYSVATVALILERIFGWVALGAAAGRAQRAVRELFAAKPQRETVVEAVGRMKAPLGLVLAYVLQHGATGSPESTQLLLEDALEAAHKRFRRSLVWLSALAGTAPFLGLLGTVRGIMNTFESIMRHGFGGVAVISAGIAEALQTTAVGLTIAIPAFVAYKLLARKADDAVGDLRGQATRVLVALGDL